MFDEEDEEEAGALAMCVDLPSFPLVCGCGTDVWNRGDFADMLGEDYLGLRELGIAAEFGMSSLSIPKRLLKGKKGKGVVAAYVLPLFLFLLGLCFSGWFHHSSLDLPHFPFSETSPHLGHLLCPYLLTTSMHLLPSPCSTFLIPFSLSRIYFLLFSSFPPSSLPTN